MLNDYFGIEIEVIKPQPDALPDEEMKDENSENRDSELIGLPILVQGIKPFP